MRGHIHVLKWNVNTKYIYMYKLWQRQIEAYQVLSKNVNSQKKTENKNINFSSQCVVLSKIDEPNRTTTNMIHDPGSEYLLRFISFEVQNEVCSTSE